MFVADATREFDTVEVFENFNRKRTPNTRVIPKPPCGYGTAVLCGNFLREGRMAEQSGWRKETILGNSQEQTHTGHSYEKRLRLFRI